MRLTRTPLPLLTLAITLIVGFTSVETGSAFAQADCEFRLGFKVLHDQLDQVGTCVDDESYNAIGDSNQHTSGGLLAWRKSDNWTAFTDGYRTWVNGPFGIQARLNTERFPWERDVIIDSSSSPAAPEGTGGFVTEPRNENWTDANRYRRGWTRRPAGIQAPLNPKLSGSASAGSPAASSTASISTSNQCTAVAASGSVSAEGLNSNTTIVNAGSNGDVTPGGATTGGQSAGRIVNSWGDSTTVVSNRSTSVSSQGVATTGC